jgi:hypothetical protein
VTPTGRAQACHCNPRGCDWAIGSGRHGAAAGAPSV